MKKEKNSLSFEEVERRFNKRKLKLLTREYKNSETLLDCEDENGYRYSISIGLLKMNTELEKFRKTNRWSIYNINKYIHDNNISTKVLETEYVNNTHPMWFKCECGQIYKSYWNEFKNRKKYYCHNCTVKYRVKRRSWNEVVSEFRKHDLEICPGQVYKNERTSLECITKEGYRILKPYSSLNNGYERTTFSYTMNKKNYVYNVNNYFAINNIDLKCLGIVDYLKDSHGLCIIDVQCSCGETYRTNISEIKRGKIACANCSNIKSRGERKIAKILNELGIRFKAEYKYDDCRVNKPLPFDFYLPDYNMCIEYNGEQHYKPVEYFGGEETFKIRTCYDKIKREYCQNNNIKLIIIPYTKFKNIKDILINNLPLKE